MCIYKNKTKKLKNEKISNEKNTLIFKLLIRGIQNNNKTFYLK